MGEIVAIISIQMSWKKIVIFMCFFRIISQKYDTSVTFGVFAVPPPPSLIVLLNDFLVALT